MAAVDPDDDFIRRYVVRWYAHDPDRHERRHQVVTAVDNKREFMLLISSLSDDLERRRLAGEAVDPQEHYSGIVLEPGHLRRQKNAHLLSKAMKKARKHGTPIPEVVLDLEMPSNVIVSHSVRHDPTDGEVGSIRTGTRVAGRGDVGGGDIARGGAGADVPPP